jgi:uncharacterized protein (DUF58 family)
MAQSILFFLLVFLILGALTGETVVFILLYLFALVYLFSRFWVHMLSTRLQITRSFPRNIFCGERVLVRLKINNNSWLPAPWLHILDIHPPEIAVSAPFQQVIRVKPHQSITLSYPVTGHKRGYYPIGPFQASTGDILGIMRESKIIGPVDHLIVYPRVLPLHAFWIDSHSPLGTIKHRQPIFEDPSRPIGKREYIKGDSMRRIDWKSTAATRKLQVKVFEPSIALETLIILNLNLEDYPERTRSYNTEFAITLAASIANWAVHQKQAVGLVTNGEDPLASHSLPSFVKPQGGRKQLMQILEVLARIKAERKPPFSSLVSEYRRHLGWGTSLVIITGQVDDLLFSELLQANKSGQPPMLIVCNALADLTDMQAKARFANIPFYILRHELDLEKWVTVPA